MQKDMAAIYLTLYLHCISNSHWRRSSKYYGSDILNPLFYVNRFWIGVKYYVAIFWPLPNSNSHKKGGGCQNIMAAKFWTPFDFQFPLKMGLKQLWPRYFDPPSLIFIAIGEGKQNIFAARFWILLLHVFLIHSGVGVQKTYGCNLLNPLHYIDFHWREGLKYYSCDILNPSHPLIFIAFGEGVQYVMATIYWTHSYFLF